jgi:hypothetical protein
MPTFKISTRIAQSLADINGITSGGNAGFGSTNTAYIRIMSGPIPTQEELELAYPEWDRFTGSPSEILIENKIQGGFLDGDDTEGRVKWGVQIVTAVRSGIASWWIWSGATNYNPADRGNSEGGTFAWLGTIVGDITQTDANPLGSMTLVDTNIIAGVDYDIGPATFPIPRTYTYV